METNGLRKRMHGQFKTPPCTAVLCLSWRSWRPSWRCAVCVRQLTPGRSGTPRTNTLTHRRYRNPKQQQTPEFLVYSAKVRCIALQRAACADKLRMRVCHKYTCKLLSLPLSLSLSCWLLYKLNTNHTHRRSQNMYPTIGQQLSVLVACSRFLCCASRNSNSNCSATMIRGATEYRQKGMLQASATDLSA